MDSVHKRKLTFGGQPIDGYRIVHGKDAPLHSTEAAADLAVYLEKTCGILLPVVTDAEAATKKEILVGSTNRDTAEISALRGSLKNDGILIFAHDGKLYLESESALGVRYAVAKFLEKYIGWRFYDEKNERLLPAESIDIPAEFCDTHSSPLLYRHTDWQLPKEYRRRVGLNGEDGIENSIVGFCHTLGALSETSNDSQPCLSDENVYQTVLKNVRQWIVEHPGCRIISITQNDNDHYCTCPKCSALAEKENQSGVMLNFVNRLADDIAVDYPDVYLLTFAYWYTRKPPVTIKPRDNVIIWLCSIECCFSHVLEDPDCERNLEFANDIRTWAGIAKQVYIWDYTTDYSRFIAPFPNFKTLLPNTKFFVDNGAIAIYEEGGYQQPENGEFRSLRGYLIAQMQWNPSMDEAEYNALCDDFLEGYYGAGWKYVREYIDKTCEKVQKTHMGIFADPVTFFPNENGQPDLPFWYDMAKLWELAEAAAEDERTAANCRHSRIQADFMIASCKAAVDGKSDTGLNEKLIRNVLDAGITRHKEGGGEFAETKYLGNGHWKGIELCPPTFWCDLPNKDFRSKLGIIRAEE